MDKKEIIQHLKETKIAIEHLMEINDKDALIYANNDLKYYQILLSQYD